MLKFWHHECGYDTWIISLFELELTPMTDAKLEALRTEIKVFRISLGTGKSLSEGLIFALTNLQYHERLFIKLQVQYMKNPIHGENML